VENEVNINKYRKGKNAFMDACVDRMSAVKEIELGMVSKLNPEQLKESIKKSVAKIQLENDIREKQIAKNRENLKLINKDNKDA
jgi:hypothetical protein